jgi:drug/metabolite transporter (DMT)-like permease
MARISDHLHLHFLVFLWGFTAILGVLISIPSVEMVFYRTLLAAIGLGAVVYFSKGSFSVTPRDFGKLILTGFIIGIHWITFFASAKVANVSVSLVGFATGSLWTAFLEPWSQRKNVKPLEIFLGVLVLMGLYIIFYFDFKYPLGMVLGVASGLTGAIYAIINARIVKRIDRYTINFYEMIGGCIVTALFFPVYKHYFAENGVLQLNPTPMDWLYILILALVCSVYAYSKMIDLLKTIPVFFIQLTINLEPVYGIIMAVIIFGQKEKMSANFYVGTVMILSAVLLYPVLKKRFGRSFQNVG